MAWIRLNAWIRRKNKFTIRDRATLDLAMRLKRIPDIVANKEVASVRRFHHVLIDGEWNSNRIDNVKYKRSVCQGASFVHES